MTRLFGSALLGLAGLAIIATGAMAGVPDPTNSDVNSGDLVIVGSNTGLALGSAGRFGTSVVGDGFRVEVRDVGNNPLQGAHVTLDYTNTGGTNPAKPYTTQIDGSTVSCPVVDLLTDVNGVALFTPQAGGFDNNPTIEVRANGVLLALVEGRSADMNGDGINDTGDLSFFATNFLLNDTAPESDFNLDGITDTGELSIFATDFLAAIAGAIC